jgi:glucosamine kinase
VNALGIDVGASSSKFVVMNAKGLVLETGNSQPFSGHIFTTESRASNFAILEKLLARVKPFQIAAVTAGITGVSLEVALEFQAFIAASLELVPEQIQITNDMDLAYRANFAPGAGILVYAGTGSIAYHVATDGSVLRSGGYGFLIDDAGGGFWIGREALKLALFRLERGISDPLSRLIFEHIGGSDWDTVRSFAYGGGRQALASLAPTVGIAVNQGSTDAQEVLTQAANALVKLAQNMRFKLERLPIVFAGGVFNVSPLLEETIAQEFPTATFNRASSALSAARMALEILKT